MHPETKLLAHTYPAAPCLSLGTIAIIVAGHAALLALLASHNVVPLPPQLTTLMVHLVTAMPAAEISPPRPNPPTRVENKPVVRPKPIPAPPSRQQLVVAQSDAPGVAADAAPVKETAAPPAAMPASAAASAAAATISAPRFDAAYLANPAPSYPSLSRKLGEEGRVVLRVLVDADGRASRIEIKSASGWARLDQAAQGAVARWKFVPARRGDEAVDAWVLVPIVFNLKS